MDLSLNEHQRELQTSVNRFLTDNYSFEQREKLRTGDLGYSAEYWRQYAELGWVALPFSEAEGGLGGTCVDTMVVMQELGRVLALEPYLATVILGGGFLRHAQDERRSEWLQQLCAGQLQCAFAHAELQGRFNLCNVAVQAERSGDGWKLNGDKTVVLNGANADLIIVSARTAGGQTDAEGISLFAVPASASGLSRRGYSTFDGARAAEVSLQDVQVPADHLIGEEGKALQLMDEVVAVALLGMGAEAVAAMEVMHADTVEYTRTREQFGVPIASFQVLQHRMVDMFMEVEQSRSVLYMAAVRIGEGPGRQAARAASALKAQVGKSGRFVGQQAVQTHGGMGVTDELRLGHYFKRLTAIENTFGNSEDHLRRFAALG